MSRPRRSAASAWLGSKRGLILLFPARGLAETAANAARTFAPNLAVGAVGQTATEITGNPLAGALAGPLAAHGVHAAGNVARSGFGALASAIPPLTEGPSQRPRARPQSEANSTPPRPIPVRRKPSSPAGDTSQVPGAPLTTGPLSDDVGLNVYEKAVSESSPEAKAAYAAHLAKQNAARQNAIAGVQPTSAVADLPGAVRINADVADMASQAAGRRLRKRAPPRIKPRSTPRPRPMSKARNRRIKPRWPASRH